MKTGVLRGDAGICMGSEYASAGEGGFLTVQPDFYGEGDSGGAGGIVQHPYGFLGRPSDGDGDGSCQALYFYEGDQLHVIPTQDSRTLAKLPALKKGGSAQYSSDGQFGSFDPETHTWTLYIPTDFDDAGTATKAHLLQIGKDTNSKRCFTLLHADGPAITCLEGGKKSIVIKNAASNAYVEVNDDGITLNGKLTIKGGLTSQEGAAVAAVARAAEVQAWAASVVTTLGQIAAYINAIAPGTVTPPVPLAASVASATLSG